MLETIFYITFSFAFNASIGGAAMIVLLDIEWVGDNEKHMHKEYHHVKSYYFTQ